MATCAEREAPKVPSRKSAHDARASRSPWAAGLPWMQGHEARVLSWANNSFLWKELFFVRTGPPPMF
jgi:hypothetical protein